MPGIEQYTQDELQAMSPTEFAAARANGFVRPVTTVDANLGPQTMSASPTPAPPQDRYADTAAAWLSDEQDFTLPSGKVCKLRSLPIEKLAASGYLDKLTRLPGITQALIVKSEGQPPVKLPENLAEQATLLVDVLNEVIPLVVVAPVVHRVPDPKAELPEDRERQVGRIYVDSIPLNDRYAILDQVVQGVGKWDSFRQ